MDIFWSNNTDIKLFSEANSKFLKAVFWVLSEQTYTWCKKKGGLTKQLKVSKKNHWSGRVVEGLFLSKAGPKRGCLSYLIEIIAILHTSDVCFPIITIRYDKHPLFGPAIDKNKPSTTRPDQCFFWTKISPPFFWASSTP